MSATAMHQPQPHQQQHHQQQHHQQQQQQQQQRQQQTLRDGTTTDGSSSASSTTETTARRPLVDTDDHLSCQWDKCTERCASAEALFDHICDKHVGRKSTNNLNLTCAWSSCRTTTVKRDHITSHIRVHVPLKPHKCDFCGKAFKRPQDLKKHVKTHADDSDLLRTPDLPQSQLAYGHSRKAPTNGYYDHTAQLHHQAAAASHYAAPHAATHHAYYTPQPTAHYGSVYYPVAQATTTADLGQAAAFDNRKRGYDALNDFFGDAKRRQLDPNSYAQVSQRLMQLQGLPIHNGSYTDYLSNPQPLMSIELQAGYGGHGGHMIQQQYALPPMPNLRTKGDLMNLDQFLEQMQATVYESSNAAAAAGVHQAGTHFTHAAVNYRSSHSPPRTNHYQQHMGHMNTHMSSGHLAAPMRASSSAQSDSSGTPALTPPLSAVSPYGSVHSPASSQDLSPISRHSSASMVSYPTLPAVSMGYDTLSTAAPASTLGTNFDDLRRRYSGGALTSGVRSDLQDGASEGSQTPTPPLITKTDTSATTKVTASGRRSPSVTSEGSSESARDRAEEMWIENIRVIEALRQFVSDRLDRKEYVEEDFDEDVTMAGTADADDEVQVKSGTVAYPTLRADDD